MDDNELELEKRRLEIDTELRREALELEKKKLEATHSPLRGWKIILTPTGAAVTAALFGIVGAVGGKYLDSTVQRNVLETSVILKASEVPAGLDEDEKIVQRASNLLWFAEAGYITLPPVFVEKLRAASGIKKGEIPDSPSLQASTPRVSPGTDTRFIGTSPSHFQSLPQESEAGSSRAYAALKAASVELSEAVAEGTKPAAIDEYWQAVGMGSPEESVRTLWNVPFICWCFLNTSPTEDFPKTASGMDLFRKLQSKEWKVEVDAVSDVKAGDILFLKRGNIGSTVMIVHHVSNDVIYAILGNSRDAVVGVEVPAKTIQSSQLIGVMRPK